MGLTAPCRNAGVLGGGSSEGGDGELGMAEEGHSWWGQERGALPRAAASAGSSALLALLRLMQQKETALNQVLSAPRVCRRSRDKKDAGLARSHRSPVLPEGEKSQPKDGDSDCVPAGAGACNVGQPCRGAPTHSPGSPNN